MRDTPFVDAHVHLWDLADRREVPLRGPELLSGYGNLSFRPGGRQLAFVTSRGVGEVWDTTAGTRVFSVGWMLTLPTSLRGAAERPTKGALAKGAFSGRCRPGAPASPPAGRAASRRPGAGTAPSQPARRWRAQGRSRPSSASPATANPS